jgi:cell division septal protein FtsQ
MPRVAAPADKRFRRAHVKPGRKRQVSGRHAWLVFRIVTVLGLALYGGWRGTALVLGAPALQVSRITVRGHERLSSGEVLALVDGLRGTNILTSTSCRTDCSPRRGSKRRTFGEFCLPGWKSGSASVGR